MKTTQIAPNRDPDILEAVTNVKLRDGSVVGLYYDMDAIVYFLTETGKNILAGQLMVNDFLDPDTLTALIHAGAQRLHPSMTDDQIRKIVDTHNLRYWVAKINQALQATLPTGNDKDKVNSEVGGKLPLPVAPSSGASGSLLASTSELEPDSSDD